MILGVAQVLLWSLILFSDMIYVIKEGQEAVVIRSELIARLEKPGIHFKLPFFEKIEKFPVGKLFIYQVEGIRVLSRDKRFLNIDASVNWKICDSLSAFKAFNYFEEKRIDRYLYLKLDDTLKRVATTPDVKNIDNLPKAYELTQRIEKNLQKKLDGYGLCIYNLKLRSTEEL
jgi:regulator of protease activity HflC (stomatin/prohibitin superfamily)